MACQRCKSERIANVSAKCADLCFCSVDGKEHEGYVPSDMGVGSGDYVELEYCLDCGQIQGGFPLAETNI